MIWSFKSLIILQKKKLEIFNWEFGVMVAATNII